MTEDPDGLFDALLALRMEWEAIAASYNTHAADLCGSLLVDGRLSPGASRQLIGELNMHVVAYDQLTRCIAAVDDLLCEAEDLRMARVFLGENPRPQPPPG